MNGGCFSENTEQRRYDKYAFILASLLALTGCKSSDRGDTARAARPAARLAQRPDHGTAGSTTTSGRFLRLSERYQLDRGTPSSSSSVDQTPDQQQASGQISDSASGSRPEPELERSASQSPTEFHGTGTSTLRVRTVRSPERRPKLDRNERILLANSASTWLIHPVKPQHCRPSVSGLHDRSSAPIPPAPA